MAEEMTCQELVELLAEYLEDALDTAAGRRFEAHLGQCPGCATYLDQIEESARLVGRLEEHHLPEPARAALLDAFRERRAGA